MQAESPEAIGTVDSSLMASPSMVKVSAADFAGLFEIEPRARRERETVSVVLGEVDPDERSSNATHSRAGRDLACAV